jgi:SAM-dependent methyltransferase
MTTDSDRVWRYFGREDPYFGVLTSEAFRRDNIDDSARDEFFRSGDEHVAEVLEVVAAHLEPDFHPHRALDFGCGVGRIVVPLARRCEHVVGVDISEAMIAEASKNAVAMELSNVEFVVSDDVLSKVPGTFDFIHSHIVFQHIPPRRGERIVQSMIARLEPGGVGVLHFTYSYSVDTPRWRRGLNTLYTRVPFVYGLSNVIRGNRFSSPLMQMNTYDLNRLFRIVQTSGCDHVQVLFTQTLAYRLPLYGVVLLFSRRARGMTRIVG